MRFTVWLILVCILERWKIKPTVGTIAGVILALICCCVQDVKELKG